LESQNKEAVIEDPIIGFRTAAPCLAANDSYAQKKIIKCDPEKMQLVILFVIYESVF